MKRKILLLCMLTNVAYIAQTNPTGNAPNPNGNTNTLARSAWYRGGNFAGGTAGNNNIFGTMGGFNSPIYTQTNGANRMKLNGTFGVPGAPQYPINGYLGGVNTSGYLLLGNDNITQQNQPSLYNSKGAFSLLHLNGTQNSGGGGFTQEFGYRPWMQTGITFTGNNDLMYLGVRRLEPGQDRSELGLTWSDNSANSFPGPDDFVFRFTSAGGGTTAYSGNYNLETDIDGRHVARFTGEGDLGLGPVFGVTTSGSPVYFRPQSRQHTANPGTQEVWHQQTNINGTGMTADDGLRIGILRNPTTTQTNGYIRWQENTPFIVQTDWDNTAGGIENGERLRISSTAAPGVPAAPFFNQNITRVSVNYIGSIPITQPRALLHLGRDNNSPSVANWMDYGSLVSTQNESVYMGITFPDYSDPLQSVIGFGGTNLVFIEANDGEVARFDETTNNLGVGDFSPTGNIVGGPTERIDVEGNGRFREVPANGGQSLILGIWQNGNEDDNVLSRLDFTDDPNDVLLGDGTWGTVNVTGADDQIITDFTLDPITNVLTLTIEDGNTVTVDLSSLQDGIGTDDQNLTGASLVGNILTIDIENGNSVSVDLSTLTTNVTADNGLTINPVAGNVQLGQINSGVGALNGGELIRDTEIPTNGFNIFLPGGGTVGQDRLIIGNPLVTPLSYKMGVWNDAETWGIFSVSSSTGTNSVAIQGEALGGTNSIGVRGIARTLGSSTNTGLRGFASEGSVWNMAADLDIPFNTSPQNYGFHSQVIGTSNGNNYGGFATAGGTNSGTNYGIFAAAFGGSTNYAGYFNGDIFIQGGTFGPSDANMKTNIQNYDSSLHVISLLEPKTFEFDNSNFQGMNLSVGHKYGFIAQEVELVLPSLIKEQTYPAQYDSLGNQTSPEYHFKGLDYEGLIPILLGGIKKQQSIISSQDSVITNLNDRLTSLENCLSGILPFLCQLGNSSIEQNDEEAQNAIVKELKVVLDDAQNIVLGQNVPNPFAEQTVIEYFIPEAVQKAQIIFYNLQGQIIKSVEINDMGKGRLNVYGNDLSSGTYTYTLVADGQVIATKKMVKTH